MFAKRLFNKATHQNNPQDGSMTITDVDLKVALHYGIPYTASILAFDPIQRLLAIGTLDGRIKIIGGDNIEGLLISPKKLPYKSLEFLQNQGYLVGVSNENDIQVWDLESRNLACCMLWESNISAFSVIHGTYMMYVGDENGLMSVLKYDAEERTLLRLPYHIPSSAVAEVAGISFPDHQSIVGILPQPATSGTRVLIAYENGVMILWDVPESCIVLVRGYTDLQLKGDSSVGSLTKEDNELVGTTSDHGQEEKEICSLCWASNNGSVLAVGYINGDILLWNISSTPSIKEQQTGISSNNVVKLELASGSRRLPVIVLHWSPNSKVKNDKGGQLFIYGGDEMGSEEVLTVLSIEWSSGIETLRCLFRVDLNLNGSFADMILIPNAGVVDNSTAALFVLTNPGQLDVYDGALLSILKPEDGKPSVQAEKFPVVIPTIDPYITATKLLCLPTGKNSLNVLLEKAYVKQTEVARNLSLGTKWPLTGGVPSELFLKRDNGVERIYIAGYQDGSLRIWDATYPILRLMFVLEGKVPSIHLESESASVSALDFCSVTMSLAIGNECGLVRVYKLHESTDASTFHFVSESKHEVHNVHHEKGFHCIAAVSAVNSLIQTLQFVYSGEKLAIGFESGQVVLLDISSLSIIFRTDCISTSNSPVVSISMHVFPQATFLKNSPKHPTTETTSDSTEKVLLVLTKDAHIVLLDSTTGNIINSSPTRPKKESTAISMYVIDGCNTYSEVVSDKDSQRFSHDSSAQSSSTESKILIPESSKTEDFGQHCSGDASYSCEMITDPHILLCCENALRLYSLKSVVQGDNKFVRKVNLANHCCWTTIFRKTDEKACGLILLYQTGVIEIRTLPDLEVLAESSLMSILRWSFKTNMDKTISSYDSGQITMVNGCEVAFISLVACENDFRIPESLPCLHDKVVAAAADAAIGLSSYQKKRQDIAPGLFGGILKGFKGRKVDYSAGVTDNIVASNFSQQVEGFFSKDPFLNPLTSTPVTQEADELSIDDIEIDEVSPKASASSHVEKTKKIDEKSDREKLFQGSTDDMKPRVRTTQEILTKYRFGGDAAAAAAHAKDKLAQRQEKLERLSKRTEELQSGAESFAEMANELVKTMENKKWWKI